MERTKEGRRGKEVTMERRKGGRKEWGWNEQWKEFGKEGRGKDGTMERMKVGTK